MNLFLATNNGLVVAGQTEDGWQSVRRGLENLHVTSVIARGGVILAGTKNGVYLSEDEGENWSWSSNSLTSPHIRWLAYHPQIVDLEFAGTEPASIFYSRDGAHSWTDCQEVASMRREYHWSLPYSPEAGCVRGFAFLGDRGYAAVEDGAVLVSNDRGQNWQLAPGSPGGANHAPQAGQVHSDVHSIAVHPSDADLVLAPTGGGLYRSTDGGKTWALLYRCYTRAIWLDANDSQHFIFSPADSVDRGGRIEETHNGGENWQDANQGLETPWPNTMVERFAQFGEMLYAVLSDGRLLATPLADRQWQPVLAEQAGHTNAVTTMA